MTIVVAVEAATTAKVAVIAEAVIVVGQWQ